MTTAQWRKAKDLFDIALELEPMARQGFLAQACPGDEELRAHLEQLLRDNERAGDFLEEPLLIGASEVAEADESRRMIGRQIDQYRIISEIGRGGMGVVYLAERADDAYHKQVAIKFVWLVWPGITNQEKAWRFKQERRILAKLDHPNIARLLDGGVTADGWQYVVMEHIAGQPITDYCAERGLSITERLKLFQQICAAVEYAHARLIVHRDLKPSNILVTAEGHVKLLDFGIAKLLDPSLLELPESSLDAAAHSLTGLQPMTPEYASPEQIRNTQITTASDVYSLGVLLYELLTGQRPYRLKSRLPHEAARVICETEPERPSTAVEERMKEEGRRMKTNGNSFASFIPSPSSLRGDLDNIVLKAMHKEPEHRYRSARDFSQDILRHLSGEPVIARKSTLIYRSNRYVQRHRASVATAGFVLLILLGAIVYFILQARAAEAESRRQRRLLYAADMQRAGQDLADRNLEHARELIGRYQPAQSKGRDDWRGFEWYYLWKSLHTEQVKMQHSTVVNELAITADGKKLLIGSDSGKIEQWEIANNRMENVFADLQEPILGLALSQDGRRLAAGGAGGLARVWDVPSGKMIFESRGHGETRIFAVALSSDGGMLATGGGDAATRLWDVSSGKLLHTFGFAGKWVRTLQFSPDGKTLAIGGTGDRALWLWDVKTFRLSATLGDSTADILHLLFSPDGKTLAAGTRNGWVRVWDVNSRALRQSFSGHEGLVWSLGFSPDGKTIASTGHDRTLRIWDRGTGQETARVNYEFEIGTLIFSPDPLAPAVFCTSGDSTRGYDLNKLQSPFVLTRPDAGDINAIAVAPNGTTIAAVDAIGTFTLWNASTGKPLTVVRNPQHSYQGIEFSPDGKLIAVTGGIRNQEAVVELRDAASGQITASLTGHAKYITSAAFSPDGKTLATGSEDRQIKLWDLSTRREQLTLKGHTDFVKTLAFSPDGGRLVSQGLDDQARVWDVNTGRQLLTIPSHAEARFSPDGKFIATGSNKHVVKLWEAATGEEIRSFRGHSGNLRAIALSPDGKRLASTGDDRTIRLWEVETGLELLALKGHTNRVSSLAFSRDGRFLVSGSKDKSVRLWRAATEEEAQAKH